ncbi:MAG: sodium/proton-translocating pyrophosphatase, partial [Opitutales bacterium]|nr:sodium/proton-translocating pyrophosphatase [Opitutales bacterium]
MNILADTITRPAALAACSSHEIPLLFWGVPAASIIALSFAFYFYKKMKSEEEGTELMQKIASHVRAGAFAYLKQQYKVVGAVFAVLAAVFAYLGFVAGVQNKWVWIAFLTGGFFSGLAGFFGMKTATYASNRSAWAANHSLDKGLRVAFRSGAVMGLTVVGLALLDIAVWFIILNCFIEALTPQQKMVAITTTMLTFGMGASLQALFARVGGGIFTKAADVGADLVGKVEAGIPEDDPRNPATIADNVGDNVGDVAGMGADLYESYCGSVLATAALGAAAYVSASPEVQIKSVIAPMLIAAVGTILSIIGIYCVKVRDGADSKQLLGALSNGVNVSSALIVVSSLGILWALDVPNFWGKWAAIIVGLAVGIAIGKVTEYYTSEAYAPTRHIASEAQTGPATVIIGGIGVGMFSTCWPVLLIVAGTALSYMFAAGGDASNLNEGLYGIGIAAVGMLSTLGITLATDAYGPIADNAG